MFNIQQPQKQVSHLDGSLEVHSIFFTIQGEGPFTGQRAVFIRLAGCNLQCPLCDTDYSSNVCRMNPEQIVNDVFKLLIEHCNSDGDMPLIVLTGGEPFRQNIEPLVTELAQNGFHVQIETNGTLYQELPYDAITVVCSPKTGAINKKLLPHVAALKYVVTAGKISTEDGLPISALDHPAAPILARPPEGFGGYIFVQPADEKDEQKNQLNTSAAVQSVLSFGYVMQLQTHKLLNLE